MNSFEFSFLCERVFLFTIRGLTMRWTKKKLNKTNEGKRKQAKNKQASAFIFIQCNGNDGKRKKLKKRSIYRLCEFIEKH